MTDDPASLFDSEELTDATIRCGATSFKVRAAILAAASTYFRKAFTGAFEVRWSTALMFADADLQQEAHTKVISLHDDDFEAVLDMLPYTYNFSYVACRDRYSCSWVLFDANMYVMGDKYDLPTLKQAAKNQFLSRKDEIDDVHIVEIEMLVNLIYNRTLPSDTTLRQKLTRAVMNTDFFTHSRRNEKREGLLAQNPTFAVELLHEYDRRVAYLQTRDAELYDCPECSVRVLMAIPPDHGEEVTYRPSCGTKAGWDDWYHSRVVFDGKELEQENARSRS